MQSTPNGLWEWFNTISPNDRLPVTLTGIIFAAFALIFVVTIVSGTIYKMHKNRLETALKHELLERGMSADEIATVVRAKPGKAAMSDHRAT